MRRRLYRGLGAGLALLAAMPAVATADTPEEALHAALSAMVARHAIAGAEVAITRNGRLLADARVGEADVASHTPLAPGAIYRLYSMSKPITTVAILMLAQEGRLKLSDPVARFLPGFTHMRVYASGGVEDMQTVPARRPITIEDLLLHRGGLIYPFTGATPVHQYYRLHGVQRDTPVGHQSGDAPPAQNLDQLVSRIAAAPLLHQPGERFDYSYSTTVLGAVVEKASGQSLGAFLQAHIFTPLAMRDTGFVVSDAQAPRLVTLYTASQDGITPVETGARSEYRDPARLRDGGGALAGTLEDYLHFAQMLANGGVWHGHRLLSQASVASMFVPRLATGGTGLEDTAFGYGLAIGDAHSAAMGGLPVGAGSWSGSGNSYFFVDPRRHLVAVLMTNELTPPAYTARTEALRRLVDETADALAGG